MSSIPAGARVPLRNAQGEWIGERDAADLGALSSVRATIDADAVRALHETFPVIVPAPGPGLMIWPVSVRIEGVCGTVGAFSETGDGMLLWFGDPQGPTNKFGLALPTVLTSQQSNDVALTPTNSSTPISSNQAENAPLVLGSLDPIVDAAPLVAVTPAGGGTGYVVGDTGDILNSNGSNPYTVLSVDEGGSPLTISLDPIAEGSSFVATNIQSTETGGEQPGVGTGLQIQVDEVEACDARLELEVLYRLAAVHPGIS